MKAHDWMASAACASCPDKDMFFLDRGGGAWKPKEICSTVCAVWKDCLVYALKTKQQDAIWGGLSVTERRRVKNIEDVRKCNKCGYIKVFKNKTQFTCNRCLKLRNSKVID